MLSNLSAWHLLIVLMVLAVTAVWVWAFISIARADSVSGTERAVWVLIVIVAPLLGALLWFAIGRGRSRTQT